VDGERRVEDGNGNGVAGPVRWTSRTPATHDGGLDMELALQQNGDGLTALQSDCTDSATSITVADGSGLPAPGSGEWAWLIIWDRAQGEDPNQDASMEIVKLTARSGNTLTVVRGQDGTTGVAHAALSSVGRRVVKADLDELATALAARLVADDGADGTVTVVTALQWNGSTLEAKSRSLTVADGQITAIGAESGWTTVPTA
jgi:hypothetical protein